MIKSLDTIKKLTPRQKRYFDLAKKQADKSTYLTGPEHSEIRRSKIAIGAVIVKGNYVIAGGFNKRKTHPLQRAHNIKATYKAPVPNIHAEIDTLIRTRMHDVSNCEIFVYRENMSGGGGNLANCRPCKGCMNALKDAGVKHVYYTTEKGYHYERIC